MGTRADFYIGRGTEAEWLGSIAWDGYPAGIDPAVLAASVEDGYRSAVAEMLAREDGTTPDLGWPWPWDDSGTTDYAYAFEDGAVYASSFGHAWFRPNPDAENFGDPDADEHGDDLGEGATFPDMSARKAVTYGKRSGVIVIGLDS